MDLYTFLKRLPKVSLHVHLAGSVQPSTLVALARKNGVTLPAYREPQDLYDYPDIGRVPQACGYYTYCMVLHNFFGGNHLWVR